MSKKKVLVAVADYPDLNGNKAMMFVHMRNLYYVKHNIDVTVLNFAAENDYVIDGINVITLNKYISINKRYDIFVAHAANIRNHYRFLKKYEERFEHLVFFFHGHEIVKINEAYPQKYEYMKEKKIKYIFQNVYDALKLYIWKKYYTKVSLKSEYIFVSNSLYKDFLYYTDIKEDCIKNHVRIINNGISEVFQNKRYDRVSEKKYDFITIRSNIDSSVYCIDLLCQMAEALPNRKFLLIGKGDWFKNNKRPPNITWIDKTISHNDMIRYIDASNTALMLTRRDSQGVMSCELASYGIPLITSDLAVCHEMFDSFYNVKMVQNDISSDCLEQVYQEINENYKDTINIKFYNKNTVEKEIDIFRGLK